jgi:ATP-binding cassette subfamily C (CFTR/MRP) protein 1
VRKITVVTSLGRQIGRIRGVTITLTDARIRLVKDIFTAIKLVKLYSWDESFREKVIEVRK